MFSKRNETVNVVTLADEKFLPNAYALIESLKSTSSLTIHLLLIGYNKSQINNLIQIENLVYHSEDEITKWIPILKLIKKSDYKYYCWTLASVFSLYIMADLRQKTIYIDSDIYFHKPIDLFLQKLEGKSIGLFRHRMFELTDDRIEGLFNVGVIYFSNDEIGQKALTWWADAVVNQKYPKYATCGDQKYLDYLYLKWGSNCYIDEGIGHGAPWHWQLYDLSKLHVAGSILHKGQEEPFLFTHFSQMKCDFAKGSYIPSVAHHNYTPMEMYFSNINLNIIYELYFKKLITMKLLYME